MENKSSMKWQNVLIIAVMAVLTGLTILGSVHDYEIANAVYIGQQPNENFFGVLFAFVGIMPTFVGWSFLGASIFCLAKKQVKSAKKRRSFSTASSF